MFFDYDRALVIGTGGGNDIVSAALVADELQNDGCVVDVAGILSPAAVHQFDGKRERVVNEIGDVRRWISRKNPKEISFIDGRVPRWAEECGYNVHRWYDFSLRYGFGNFTQGLCELIERENYDTVIAVDVGGDILARDGVLDPTVLSPYMDLSVLSALPIVHDVCKLPVHLLEFGLGTDGELRPLGMKDIIDDLRMSQAVQFEANLLKTYDSVEKLRSLYEKVCTVRRGHTLDFFFQTLEQRGDFHTTYDYSFYIGKEKIPQSFPLSIPREFLGTVYAIDPLALAKRRNHYRGDVLSTTLQLKTQNPAWKTEMDLFYTTYESLSLGPKSPSLVHILMPSQMYGTQIRKKVLESGLEMLQSGEADIAILHASDVERFSLATDLGVSDGNIVAIGGSDAQQDVAKELLQTYGSGYV